ncbi:MAG TPA: pheophorbide a oxygenase, partial [Cyanothece sp. UBA12306]|nr:pheophorbide a oxygenase [Cyanothece sp. UBA12306]
QPLPMTVVESSRKIIKVEVEKPFKTRITFEPPNRLEYAINIGNKGQVGLVTYCLPVYPGKSRIVA